MMSALIFIVQHALFVGHVINMSVNVIVANVSASTVKIGTVIQDESGSYWVSLHIVGHPRWKKLQARHRRIAKREAAFVTLNYALVVALHTDVFVKTGMKVQILIPVKGDCQCTTACKDHILKVMKRQWGEHCTPRSCQRYSYGVD